MTQWFRTRLRRARERAGISQRDLATRLGVVQATVSYWENGTVEPANEIRDKVESFIRDWPESSASGTADIPTEEPDAREESDDAESTVSTWLATARVQAGMSRHELGQRAGLAPQTIYLIETGKIANPRASTLQALTKALGSAPSAEQQEEIEEATTVKGVGEFRDFDPHSEEDLPTAPGVYVFYDVSDRPIYVGKAASIRARVKSHSEKFWFRDPIVQTAAYVEIQDEALRDQVETLLIKFLKKNAVINKQKRHRGDDESD